MIDFPDKKEPLERCLNEIVEVIDSDEGTEDWAAETAWEKISWIRQRIVNIRHY